MAKIIEAKAVISGKETLSPLVDALSKKLDQLGKNKGMAQQVDKVAASLKGVQAQMAVIDKFQTIKTGFRSAADNFSKTQAAVQAAAAAMRAGEGPAKRLAADYQRAQTAASNAAKAFDAQRTAFAGARRAMETMGVPARRAAQAQEQLRAAIEKTNAAMLKQEGAATKGGRVRQFAGGVGRTVGTLGGLAAGAKAKSFAGSAIEAVGDFDRGVREQRVFTDINAQQQKVLIDQAKRIGQETQFTNLDVVKAQTATMQGLPSNLQGSAKAEVAAGIVEHVKYYSTLMKVDLQQAAEAVRGYLQQTGKNLATQDSALGESQKAVNKIVKMAKIGGITGDDAQMYLKYAAAASNASGIDENSSLALGALAKRGGLAGAEAGTFMRTVAAKLVAPGIPGITALSAAGLDYAKYVTMPDQLDANRLNMQLQNRLGISMDKKTQDKVQRMLKDKSVLGSQGVFTHSLLSTLEESGLVGKEKGAASKAKVASALGSFFGASAQSVDSQRLLNDIMGNENISLAQLNMLLGYRMGGRGAITTKQRGEYNAAVKTLGSVGDDPDWAKRKADEVLAGVGGALINAKGSFENLTLAVGEANQGLIKWTADLMGSAADKLSSMSPEAQQAVSLGGMGLAGAAGLYGMVKLFNGFGLSASAAALDGAAAALTGAALTLKGGAAAGVATNAAGGAVAAGSAGATAGAAATWGTRLLGAVPFLTNPLLLAGGVAVGGLAASRLINELDPVGASQEAKLRAQNAARRRRGMTEAFNSDRERMGLPPLGGMSAPAWPAMVGMGSAAMGGTTELTGSAEVTGEATLKVEVGASSHLLQIIEQARNIPLNLSGQLNANGPGSVGKSSPDATAPAQVGPR